jgi:hypothetical protein
MINKTEKNKPRGKKRLWPLFGYTLFFLMLAVPASAATLYFETGKTDIYVGDVFLVDFKLESEDKDINALEGRLFFDQDILEVKDISAGGSVFNIWMKEPLYSSEKGEISFTGGVAGGYQGGGAEIFKIVFRAKTEGKTKIDFRDDTALFLNDGQGTKFSPWMRTLEVAVAKRPADVKPKDEWKEYVAEDKAAPEQFDVTMSENAGMFGGKKFISFFTTDRGSGIDHYEVKEGRGLWHLAQSPYLLKDQELRSIIKVAAVDKAGNRQEVELAAKNPPLPLYRTNIFWISVAALIVLVFIGIIIIKKWRK